MAILSTLLLRLQPLPAPAFASPAGAGWLMHGAAGPGWRLLRDGRLDLPDDP